MNPIEETAWYKMEMLGTAAWEAYKNQQLTRAAELCEKALEIADSIGDQHTKITYRSWYGVFLIDINQLQKALMVLTPILQEKPEQGSSIDDLYLTLISYISVAQKLPVSLKAIEKGYTQMNHPEYRERRHNMLYMKAGLCLLRGMYPEALKFAQESWLTRRQYYSYHIIDVHLNILIRISLAMRNTEMARKYLLEWENLRDERPKYKEREFSIQQADLARLEKRPKDALDWARRAVMVDSEDINTNRETLMRVFLSMGECEQVRPSLVAIAKKWRRSENGHHRYLFQLLLGDYYLALARELGNIPPVDDEFDLELPPLPTKITNPIATNSALQKAKQAYTRSLNVGRWIDHQLECMIRQEILTERLERVKQIEHCL